jgi:hypothetical protein
MAIIPLRVSPFTSMNYGDHLAEGLLISLCRAPGRQLDESHRVLVISRRAWVFYLVDFCFGGALKGARPNPRLSLQLDGL